jgi:chaperone required for assembly of F1-ATPase
VDDDGDRLDFSVHQAGSPVELTAYVTKQWNPIDYWMTSATVNHP